MLSRKSEELAEGKGPRVSNNPDPFSASDLAERLLNCVSGVTLNGVSIVILFVAGELFTDLPKSRSNPHLVSECGFA